MPYGLRYSLHIARKISSYDNKHKHGNRATLITPHITLFQWLLYAPPGLHKKALDSAHTVNFYLV